MTNIHEEEKLGKAYASRLLKRLAQYLPPYKWRVVLAILLVVLLPERRRVAETVEFPASAANEPVVLREAN